MSRPLIEKFKKRLNRTRRTLEKTESLLKIIGKWYKSAVQLELGVVHTRSESPRDGLRDV